MTIKSAFGAEGSETFRVASDPPVTYPPVGKCIYCPDDGAGGLGDEHIIAYALNGTRVLPKASCPRCARVTSYRGLISYGFDAADQFRQGAIYADKILRGAKPADLPVQHPTKFQIVINLKTAKVLGLTIAPTLIARADDVIE
ncbi:MAG: ABC transporter substrate binding protein [Xanthobacteraceae bacterium]